MQIPFSSLLIWSSADSVPFHMGLFLWQLQSNERISKIEVSVFYNLISEVKSYHFCCILFKKRITRSNPHSGGGDYTRLEHRTRGFLAAILGTAYNNTWYINYVKSYKWVYKITALIYVV